jgi:hypothetical protein
MCFGERSPALSADERRRRWQHGQTSGASFWASTFGIKSEGLRRIDPPSKAESVVARDVERVGNVCDGEA